MEVGTRFHYIPETDTTAIERVQDCTPILDHATALRNEGIHGGNEMRHAARFPAVVVESYCNRVGITFDEWMQNPDHIRAMLNDPDLKGFRVWGGRV
jgi:hypothetical protein